jgi:serine/threonine protein kinase/Flp pilus assembly protein TadD
LGQLSTDPVDRGPQLRPATTDGGQRFVPTHASWTGGRCLEAELGYQATLANLALIDEPEPVIVGHDGRYAIRRLIGRGAMGAVYIADDMALRRPVAIKVVSRQVGDRQGFQDRLRREAWALALLDHPNVLSVYDVDLAASGELFVVMQYVPGQNLREWAQSEQRSRAQILAVMIAAGRGLAAAHAKGLVHRDFKPDNVMICEDAGARRVLVADFGLAGGAPLRPPLQLEASRVVGLAGGVVTSPGFRGTPAYMSPEQLRGEAVDTRSDQYAFCVSLWELLVGERPDPSTAASSRPQALPGWLYARLLQGLAADPSDRHPDMQTLLDGLERTPARRRFLGSLAGAMVLGGGLAGGAAQLQAKPELAQVAVDHCVDADHDMLQIWNPTQRQALATRLSSIEFVGTDAVLAILDQAATRWRADRIEACHQDRASPCHDRWLRRFDRRIELLHELDAAHEDRVVELLERLRTGSYCDPILDPLPEDVADQLDQAEIQAALGEYPAAIEIAEAVWRSAPKLGSCTSSGGYSYEAGAASFRLGYIHGERHDADEALEWLDRATLHAYACHNDMLMIAVQLRTAKTLTADRQDPITAARSLALAEAVIASVAELPTELSVEHQLSRGLVELHRAQYEQATTTFEKVLPQLDDQPLLALEALINLGVAADGRGDPQGARLAYVRAQAFARELPGNPPEADILILNRGLAERDLGQLDRARDLLALAKSGPHPSVQLRATAALIEVEVQRNNLEAALELARDALDLVREHPDQPADDRAPALMWAGQIMVDTDPVRGLEALAEALDIYEAQLPDTTDRVLCEVSLASNYLQFGEVDRARERYAHLRSLDPELTEPALEYIDALGRELEEKPRRD